MVPYPSAEEAFTRGAGRVRSLYMRPVTEWTRTEEADATVFTSKYVIPFSWLSRLAILYVDEASGAYEVLINGKKVGYAANAFSPAVNLTALYCNTRAATISLSVTFCGSKSR